MLLVIYIGTYKPLILKAGSRGTILRIALWGLFIGVNRDNLSCNRYRLR